MKLRTYGKPIVAEVGNKKEYAPRGFKTYEIMYTVDKKEYKSNVDKHVYDKIEIGMKIEVLKYKRKTMMYDSYDLDK
ncbi:hypothetical protein ACW0JX_02215 [Bacillus sp. C-3-6]